MSKVTIGIIIIIGAALIYLGLATDAFRSKRVTDFASCVAYGNPVMESYPRQCRDDEGNLYVEDVEPQTPGESDQIRIDAPAEGERITSPFTARGIARGPWYFEASFPIVLEDVAGAPVDTFIATAEGEWMTEDFVPFEAPITFSVSTITPATLVFKKDNPSGLPENDAEVRVSVMLAPGTASSAAPGGAARRCVVGGCSSQLCTDAADGPAVSTCEYREEYACYASAICEVQPDGECGWTETAAFNACMANI